MWPLLGLAVPIVHLLVQHRPGSVHSQAHRRASQAHRLVVNVAWFVYLGAILFTVFLVQG